MVFSNLAGPVAAEYMINPWIARGHGPLFWWLRRRKYGKIWEIHPHHPRNSKNPGCKDCLPLGCHPLWQHRSQRGCSSTLYSSVQSLDIVLPVFQKGFLGDMHAAIPHRCSGLLIQYKHTCEYRATSHGCNSLNNSGCNSLNLSLRTIYIYIERERDR